MKNTNTTKMNQLLGLNFNDTGSIWLTKQKTLRTLVGILGMLLPFLLWFFLLLDNLQTTVLNSISHYYYTRVSSIFVLVLGLLAFFLLIYKGYNAKDFIASSLAGIFALCVVFFPTSNISDTCCDPTTPYALTILRKSGFRVGFHYFSAAVFLSSLAYISLFLFTKSDKSPSKRTVSKIKRNRVYRICGGLMLLAILVIATGQFLFREFYDKNHLTFWMETLAVESFGISWLVKGEWIWKD